MTDYIPDGHQINELPTAGDCYQSSFRNALGLYQVKMAVENGTATEEDKRQYPELKLENEIFIFHGYATSPGGPDAGRRIHHAWIEIGDVAFETQGGTARRWPRKDYYETFSVYPNERYSVVEAMNNVLGTPGVTENYGPWRGVGEDICPHDARC